jgi:uncharacterized Zn finger protein
MSYYGFAPYVSVAQRRANAARAVAKMVKKGRKITPVRPEGRAIAQTFWGNAWCDNLESYSDYANRLPRGRTYVRNGSVVDLQVAPGKVTALVSGSSLYSIEIGIKPLPRKTWLAIKTECAGKIGSMVELLQGRLSQSVMEIITRPKSGLFPSPSEIKLDCSCPDWADMCKHVAAALYGVGTRLDERPELLFALRKVDHLELIEQAGNVKAIMTGAAGGAGGASDVKTIAVDQLTQVFGIELDAPSPGAAAAPVSASELGTTKPTKARSRRSPAFITVARRQPRVAPVAVTVANAGHLGRAKSRSRRSGKGFVGVATVSAASVPD